MRIVMLGHTGVGKTTYMASLYGVMQQSIEGFRLRAVQSEDHKGWVALAERIRQGKYPAATDQRQEYDFYLRYEGRKILQFAWADYRGGAIRETQESEQAKSLLQDLKTADGVMLFCDCHALAQGDLRSNQIGRMTALTVQALQELNQPMSLVVILTKNDLVANFQENLLAPLAGLIAAVNASELILGSLIPIACGKELRNVSMPLLFVLHSAVVWQAITAYSEVEKHEEQAKIYEKSSQGLIGAVDWIVSKISDEPTYRAKARKEREEANAKQREFEEIQAPALSLYQYVQKLPMFKPELTLSDYIQQLTQIREGTLKDSVKDLDPFSVFN